MTEGQPTEPIQIDPHPTQPICIDPDPTIPVPSVGTSKASGPVAIVPPPFAPPATGAASPPVSGPAALSHSGEHTAGLPLSPPTAPPTASFLGATAGPGDGFTPTTPPNDRIAELQRRLDDAEAATKRRTRIAVGIGVLAVAAAVGATLAADSWNDNRQAAADSAAPLTPSQPSPTVPVPPAPTPSTPPRGDFPPSTSTPDDERTRNDDPSGRERGGEGRGETGGPNGGQSGAGIPSTGIEQLDEWIDQFGLEEAWERFQELQDQYLDDANQWLEDLFGDTGGSTSGSNGSGNTSDNGAGRGNGGR